MVGTLTPGYFPGDIVRHSLWFILFYNAISNPALYGSLWLLTAWKQLLLDAAICVMTAGPHGHRCIPTLLHCEDSSKDTVLRNIHGNDSTPYLSQWNQCNIPAFAKHLTVPQSLKSYCTEAASHMYLTSNYRLWGHLHQVLRAGRGPLYQVLRAGWGPLHRVPRAGWGLLHWVPREDEGLSIR